MLPLIPYSEAPEWPIVRRAVAESRLRDGAAWQALGRCTYIEAYTDGSAPIVNPGGPAGFAAVLLGWAEWEAPGDGATIQPAARVNLTGFIPPRNTDPATSNNRAEVAGIMAALAAACALAPAPRRLVIWSDSDYAVSGATGRHKRKRNLDLWAAYDDVAQQANAILDRGVALQWLKGHAGHTWNNEADALATRAAFDFDQASYDRYRAAQRATGREMPNRPDLLAAEAPAEGQASAIAADTWAWPSTTHYTLVLYSRIDGKGAPGVGRGPAVGRFQLRTRTGQSAQGEVRHTGERTADEAEYLTLIAALDDLLGRISAKHGDPAKLSVTVFSRHELVVKQLDGTYRVTAASLQAPHRHARALLARFAQVELVWKQGHGIDRLFRG